MVSVKYSKWNIPFSEVQGEDIRRERDDVGVIGPLRWPSSKLGEGKVPLTDPSKPIYSPGSSVPLFKTGSQD